jgi:hypothetical protein
VHELHYTPLGLELLNSHKSANGPNEVAPGDENDPAHICDPQGFPRENLFEVRATEIIQTPLKTILLYTYDKCQGRSKTRPRGRRESRPLPRKLRVCIEGFAGAAGA